MQTAASQMMVEPYPNLPASIASIQFGLISTDDAHRLSVLPCRRVIGPVQDYGVNDKRLGVCERMALCGTCGKSNEQCSGHSGHIDLDLPVFHSGFFSIIIRICRTICKTCSRVLLEPEEVAYHSARLSRPMEAQQRMAIVKSIQLDAYKTHVCVSCGALNGDVKRGKPMRIIHDKYAVQLRRCERTDSDDLSHQLASQMASSIERNKDLGDRLSKMVEVLDPMRVRDLFSRILPSELCLLGFQADLAHPVDLIISTLVVPPVCTRPSGGGGGGMMGPAHREDDLTTQLNEILICSDLLKDGANDVTKYMETWDMLQTRVARVLDAQMPGFPATLRSNETKSYTQRLKGKNGRFRGNLSGKRVDFSGRSVISPDPNLAVDELAVPLSVARVLTYPQRVFAHNLELMRRLVRNGPNVHPGAVTVYLAAEKSRRSLRNMRDRLNLAARLTIGDVVERHVLNGDMIIFNRQPSLHRISMMAHRARVLPYKTFRFNECCCSPYNADFDGDEMNVHLVQTEEARAEARELMLTAKNIITAKNGEPIIACTQDFLMAAYMVTSRESFFDRSQFSQMISYWIGAHTQFELPIPALLCPTELWTGKQIFEVILQPSPSEGVMLSMEAKARFYGDSKDRHWDSNEGFVAFLDSKFISGRLDKKLLGGGAKDSLFARLFALTNGDYTAQCMSRIAHFTSRYLQNYGFSIGLADVSPTVSLEEEKSKALSLSFAECDRLIHEASTGHMIPLPGLTLKQSLEAKLNNELSKVRNTCGAAAVRTLDPRSNAPLMMVNAGSKGSELNTAQMMACVGQQTVNGKRIINAFDHRSLPHFHRYAEDPAARGFVASSFYSGLSPTEFFFHTMAGREGLVDTAVKTAETGYIYRRLSKALENMSVKYDNTVRDAQNTVVQFRYGEDGLDPWLMEGNNGTPLNLAMEWLSCHSGYARREKRRSDVHSTLEKYLTLPLKERPAAVAKAVKDTHVESAMMSESLIHHWYEASLLPHEVQPFVKAALSGDAGLLGEATQQHQLEMAEQAMADRVRSGGHKQEEVDSSSSTSKSRAERQPFTHLRRMCRTFCLKFLQEVEKFFEQKVKEQKRLRELLGLPVESSKAAAGDEEDDMQFVESLQSELLPLTRSMVLFFLENCAEKYGRKACEPGTPCGAIAAQSVGEPSTQMTLRTFHFAGVASMSITQGVPRLVEIVNANANISTPVITVPVTAAARGEDEEAQRQRGAAAYAAALHEACLEVKGHVEKVCLKDIALEMVEVMTSGSYQLQIRLNLPLIKAMHLPIDVNTVRRSILYFAGRPLSPLRMLKEDNIQVISQDALVIYPYMRATTQLLFSVKQLLTILPEMVVGGINGVNRVMVTDDHKQLLVEGTDLRAVMALPYVDGVRCRCNHVSVIEKTLGIEAARQTIVEEIQSIMKAYSLSIDIRHVYLLADVMTNRGTVLGITRYGLQKMNNSVLTMASFERTTEHLYNAAVLQRKDRNLSVSDSIIIGKPIAIGTTSFSVLMDKGGYCKPMASAAVKSETVAPVSPPVKGKVKKLNTERWGGYARYVRPEGLERLRPLAVAGAFRVDIPI